MSTMPRLTVADLELLPDPLDDTRYELIDGELHVSKQPHWYHQVTSTEITGELWLWARPTNAGRAVSAPGVIFGPDDAVAPDVVWVRRERLAAVLGEDGKLHAAPDLVVEVLSPGSRNESRDLELKVSLYSRYGVLEYWIADWRDRTLLIYRRQDARLVRVATLTAEDTLTSPLLPGFEVPVARLFPDPDPPS